MIPGGTVIPGPCGAVPLASGIAGTSHHKWPLVRSQPDLTFISRARVLHAEDIVDLPVQCRALAEARFVDAMLYVIRHRFARAIEDRRLVHVIPEAGNPLAHEILVEQTPPLTRTRLREIGEDRGSRPYLARICRAVRQLNE